ncbi:MAG: hypothetical protein UX72_C0002G0016 [Parcubacteria group bacterium GW2011_GWA2_47_10]|nr:MAG: hypothetical protein UX72_C0002G0016 [Parcubacteria group bacterium GW2011_GWA2_47_10]
MSFPTTQRYSSELLKNMWELSHIFFHMPINKTKWYAWRHIHTLPQSIARHWQLRELRFQLRQAYSNVPFYRQLLDKKGVHPDDVRSFDDIQKLPIINKGLMRKVPVSELVNKTLPLWAYNWTETSGSTGEPFRFPTSRPFYFYKHFGCPKRIARYYRLLSVGAIHTRTRTADVYVDRFLLWRGFSFGHISRKFRFADIRTVNRPRGRHFLHVPVSDVREHPTAVIEKLTKFQPDVVSGRVTTLIELAQRMNEFGTAPLNIPFITSVGEMTTEAQKNYLAKAFGAEVYDRYGLEELGDVAIECREHNGMHIHEESDIVEIVDDRDSPVSPGAPGRVVVTNLCNYSVPFIRYDTGDRGKILPGKCPCGIPARRLIIYGRLGAFLEVGGKKYQFPEFAAIVASFSDIILRSQVVKLPDNTIELRIIPARKVSEKDIQLITETFKKQLSLTPRIILVEKIPFNASGKTQFLRDEGRPI